MLHDQNNSLKRELAENVNELRLTVQKIEQRESRCSELFIRFEEEILKLKAENSNLIEERRNNTSVKSADNWKRLKAEKSMQDLDIRLHAFESEFRLIEQTLAKASQASQLKRYQQLQQHQRNDSTSSENSASGGGGDGGFDSENENLLKRTSELYQAPMTEDRISSISYGVQLLLEERLKAEANLEVVMDKLKRLESGMSLRSSVSQPSPRCESAVTSSDAMAKINKVREGWGGGGGCIKMGATETQVKKAREISHLTSSPHR